MIRLQQIFEENNPTHSHYLDKSGVCLIFHILALWVRGPDGVVAPIPEGYSDVHISAADLNVLAWGLWPPALALEYSRCTGSSGLGE